jgi:glucokinase
VRPSGDPRPVLLADIGGTYARFTLANERGFGPVTTLGTENYEDAGAAIQAFFDQVGISSPPEVAALACAGPVEQGFVQLTNSNWQIDAAGLQARLGIDEVILVNDFAAVAWAIPSLKDSDLCRIGGGKPVKGTPAAVLGPGTGLGVASYVPHEGGATVIVGEGGHVTMPATTRLETALFAELHEELDHVSAERVLSGDGLERLYKSLARLTGDQAPERTAAGIASAALAQSCGASQAALDMFCAMLGTFAGNVALTFGARGGIYIAGGMVPKIVNYLAASEFRRRFEAKGRFRDYMARIPVWVILHPEPACLGLMRVLRRDLS